jgi:hypothetical protein
VPDPIGALVAYGLDDARRADLDAKRRREPASPEAEIGRIIRVDRGESNVVTERGVLRVLSDSTRSQGDIAPATGDWVLVDEVGDKHPVIVAVADRRKTLVRRDPSEAIVDQVMVANVDTVMIVHGLDRPFPPGRLERFLIIAWDSGAQPVLVLTKADLPELVEDTVATVHALAPDTPVVLVRRDDVASIDAVRAWIPAGTTAALVGQSTPRRRVPGGHRGARQRRQGTPHHDLASAVAGARWGMRDRHPRCAIARHMGRRGFAASGFRRHRAAGRDLSFRRLRARPRAGVRGAVGRCLRRDRPPSGGEISRPAGRVGDTA